MRGRYTVRPKAEQDIDEIADYLVEHSGLSHGLQLLSEIYNTFELLASNKALGWRCKVQNPELKSARTFPASKRFDKFMIFYLPCQDGIEILRVLHGAQDLQALFQREPID